MSSDKREKYKAMIARRKIVELALAGLSVAKIASSISKSVRYVTMILEQEKPR